MAVHVAPANIFYGWTIFPSFVFAAGSMRLADIAFDSAVRVCGRGHLRLRFGQYTDPSTVSHIAPATVSTHSSNTVSHIVPATVSTHNGVPASALLVQGSSHRVALKEASLLRAVRGALRTVPAVVCFVMSRVLSCSGSLSLTLCPSV